MNIMDLEKTTKGRYFINTNMLPKLARRLPNGSKILFVGIDTSWEYRSLFWNPSKLCEFNTMDIKQELLPDIVGDISSCPQIENDTYDLIILIGVYEYVVNKSGMFSEINRILKPTGKAFLSLPGRGYYDDPKNAVEPWEVWTKIAPLKVEEMYVIEDQPTVSPSSVHVIAVRKDARVGERLWQR